MTAKPNDRIDWSLTTWKGSRLKQHREFYALSFARKLELIEDMATATSWLSSDRTAPLAVQEPPPAAVACPPSR
jgi:hypothetical protein